MHFTIGVHRTFKDCHSALSHDIMKPCIVPQRYDLGDRHNACCYLLISFILFADLFLLIADLFLLFADLFQS